jgi:thiosulfate/3-mercaptopyruvate sulfurtransferase
MNDWTTLVSAEDLHAALGRDDLVVLDARVSLADRSAGGAMYLEGHIPGARHADLDRDLSDHRKPHAGRHPWPDAPDFCATLRRWGVHAGDQVVVYDVGDGALAAARAWFLLRALGHRRVAVLDGGWMRWCALGLPIDTDVPAPQPSDYEARFDESRLLDATAVQAHLRTGGALLDARAAERFRGEVEPLDKAAGHVPGATNRPYAANLRDGRFKPAQELSAEFGQAIGTHPPQDVVAMCGSGVTACHHLLAMEHAGLPGGRLFTDSWSGWIDDPQRPVAVGD